MILYIMDSLEIHRRVFSPPDLATIAPEMQTALGPNLLTSFPTIGPLKE